MAVAETLDLPAFRDYLRRLPGRVLKASFRKPLLACSVVIKNELKKDMAAGRSPDGTPYKPLAFPRPNGTTSPLWDTGAMARSLGSGVNHVETITDTSLELGTNAVQAHLHQYGGVVRPRKGKFLAVPLTMAARRAGSPRNFPAPLRPVIGRRGGVLVGKGKRGKETAQYALAREVKVPARPFIGISPAAEAQCRLILAKAVADRI